MQFTLTFLPVEVQGSCIKYVVNDNLGSYPYGEGEDLVSSCEDEALEEGRPSTRFSLVSRRN